MVRKTIKRIVTGFVIAVIAVTFMALPAYAIDTPDTPPTVEDIYCFRNILETGDFFILIYEDTPYATPPTTPYDEAFIWRLYDTDDTTELAQAVGYDYNDYGYNENVIGFYFDADDAPTWGENYYIKLTGTPTAFATPPTYEFQITDADYSDLTNSIEVKASISSYIIEMAEDLNVAWGLASDDYLTTTGEVDSVLSAQGETFFRGAIYGIQSLAPGAFSIVIINITNEERTWGDNYTSAIEEQFDGNYIGTAMDAGNEALGADYNLFGLIGLLACIALLMGACVYVGGDIWGSLAIAAGPLVIGGRLALLGMGELALVAACMWLFTAGKVWKVF